MLYIAVCEIDFFEFEIFFLVSNSSLLRFALV